MPELEQRIRELEEEVARLRTRSLRDDETQTSFARAMTEREAVFGEVERLAKVGSWVWDVRTNQVAWSPELYRIFGYDRDVKPTVELFFDTIHPDDREAVKTRSELSSSRGLTEPGVRCRVLRKDGSIRHIVLVGSSIRDTRGDMARLVGAVMDISEFVGQEAELRRTAALLNEAQRIARIGSWIWHRDTDDVEWSETLFSILGLDGPTRGNARRLLDRVHPEDRASIDAFRIEMMHGRTPAPLSLRVLRPDGTIRYVTMNAKGQADDLNGPIVGTVQDVTPQWELEQQLRHSQKMEAVGALAGGVAHDFNNYLVVIRGNLDLLRGGFVDESERQMLEEIARATERCATLTRQLLAFARKHPNTAQLVDIERIVVESASMLRRLLGAHIELVVDIEPCGALVLADPSQLELVIVNLAVNARDAMPSGGRLTIALAPVDVEAEMQAQHRGVALGPHVRLTVTDTGAGIPDELQPRVFEPFFTTKNPGHGTGLGLATVYGIVRQAGGHIDLQSRVGEGTTFSIFLPSQRGVAVRREDNATAAAAAHGETVLLVEDEPAVRRLTRRLLERGGYRVLEAEDGVAALEVSERERFDLLLTDVTMPRLDGIRLAQRLRADRPKLPLLMMSGYPDLDARGITEQELGCAILSKPFTLESLLDAVRAALEKNR